MRTSISLQITNDDHFAKWGITNQKCARIELVEPFVIFDELSDCDSGQLQMTSYLGGVANLPPSLFGPLSYVGHIIVIRVIGKLGNCRFRYQGKHIALVQ